MTRIQLILGLTTCVAMTLVAAAVQGRLSGRWGVSHAIRQTADTLEALPDRFGDWEMVEQLPLGEAATSQLQPYGYVSRIYENVRSRERVALLVLMGRVGPTAVHTPEICMSSAFEAVESRTDVSIQSDGKKSEHFWAMTFRSKDVEGGLQRVYFGWSDGSHWVAETGVRYRYAGLPYLYKIQLSAAIPTTIENGAKDPCKQFLTDVLPVLHEHMSQVD